MGFVAAGGTRGDFYAVLRFALPELTPKQAELLAELAMCASAAPAGGARTAAADGSTAAGREENPA